MKLQEKCKINTKKLKYTEKCKNVTTHQKHH